MNDLDFFVFFPRFAMIVHFATKSIFIFLIDDILYFDIGIYVFYYDENNFKSNQSLI